ncbi:hypothetical protein K8640_16745 [Myxococcus sp. XM-1-1-1]|uniref:hypothetical protein n=1 Tax=Myxococcus sp. XM-1-1-1 TaxID=2874602 RepID=UPI001CBFD5B4|nr:hypothetical protein [Myxococcus sp. XM-1-1-1]MBZ4409854.1 hypothetical protein [Myxococcus sp. XM-1-1-1]
MPPAPSVVRIVAMLCLIHGTAHAEPWKKARPGVTTEAQLRILFGEPDARRREDGALVLDYQGQSSPAGTQRARFTVDTRTRKLRRIDVFPTRAPTRAAVEKQFGPACPKTGWSKKPCYVVKATADTSLYFHYPSRGLAVFFAGGDVRALTYQKPVRGKLALTASVEPPPELSSAGTVAPEEAGDTVSASGTASEDDTETADGNTVEAFAEPAAATQPAVASLELAVPTIEGETEAPRPAPPMDVDTSLRPVVVDDVAASGTSVASAAGGPTAGPQPVTEDAVEEDPLHPSAFLKVPELLTVGGFYLQRAEVAGARRASTSATGVDPFFPALLDVYLDFKPFDGLRSFAVGRMAYDPLDPVLSTPATSLDRLWIYFGLFDHVFITAGRQHIKWGSSKIWNTTDFLRARNPDPLFLYDLRPGVDMVKVNVPWEEMAANLWLIGTADLLDEVTADGDRVRYGGAVRAEMALGTSELAVSGSFMEGRRPRYGVDYSIGLGRLDFNTEIALVHGADVATWERSRAGGFQVRALDGLQVQASGGAQVELRVADTFKTVVRLEGFYNQLGSDDRELLTWVQAVGDFQPLYFGRFYGMAQVAVTARNIYEPTTTLTVMGNVGDPSYVARLDINASRLRDVTVAAYVEVPFGERGGEFRFQPDASIAPSAPVDMGLFRAGINVRLRL